MKSLVGDGQTGVWESHVRAMRSEWAAITGQATLDLDRFEAVKAEADAIVNAGRWTSGPDDLLGVLGRRRDELMHSRVLGWLLVPTNKHGLGRRFLRSLLDHVWPGEALMTGGPVVVELETQRTALDPSGVLRTARADIVVRGEDACVVIENKVDAGEQLDQCERLYWAWADQAIDTRYLFLTPTGRPPTTTLSVAVGSAWRTLSYREVREIAENVASDASGDLAAAGRSTVEQYVTTLRHIGAV